MGKHDRSGPGRSSIIGSDLKPSDKATLQLRRLCHHPPPHNSDRATFAQSHREHGQAPCVRDPGRLPAHEGARPTAEARNGRAKPPATGMPGQQARHRRHAGVPRAPGRPAAAPATRVPMASPPSRRLLRSGWETRAFFSRNRLNHRLLRAPTSGQMSTPAFQPAIAILSASDCPGDTCKRG